MLPRIPRSFLGILTLWSFCNWASGAARHRKITRQSRWNLRRASDKAIPNQAPGMVGEGVETGWRASLVDEGTVRLSPKGESDRITRRSAVHCQRAVAFACLEKRRFPEAVKPTKSLSGETVHMRCRSASTLINATPARVARRRRYDLASK